MSSIDIRRLQLSLLVNEQLVLAWSASVQRAHVYHPSAKNHPHRVEQFRRAVFSAIRDMLPQYVAGCDEKTHVQNIEALATYASQVDSTILGMHGYKVGIAQKLLNLTLKYLWCLEFIVEPPHCPVDRIICDKTGQQVTWTTMETIAEYCAAIESIRRFSEMEKLTIAQWELANYARRLQVDIGLEMLLESRKMRLRRKRH